MVKTTETNSGAHVGAESNTITDSPEDLIGRTVAFLWNTWHHKPIPLTGKVISAGRAPGTVIIQATTANVPARKNYSRKVAWAERIKRGGALHCRSVSEIEVLT